MSPRILRELEQDIDRLGGMTRALAEQATGSRRARRSQPAVSRQEIIRLALRIATAASNLPDIPSAETSRAARRGALGYSPSELLL